jgi:hypothetical protein
MPSIHLMARTAQCAAAKPGTIRNYRKTLEIGFDT